MDVHTNVVISQTGARLAHRFSGGPIVVPIHMVPLLLLKASHMGQLSRSIESNLCGQCGKSLASAVVTGRSAYLPCQCCTKALCPDCASLSEYPMHPTCDGCAIRNGRKKPTPTCEERVSPVEISSATKDEEPSPPQPVHATWEASLEVQWSTQMWTKRTRCTRKAKMKRNKVKRCVEAAQKEKEKPR